MLWNLGPSNSNDTTKKNLIFRAAPISLVPFPSLPPTSPPPPPPPPTHRRPRRRPPPSPAQPATSSTPPPPPLSSSLITREEKRREEKEIDQARSGDLSLPIRLPPRLHHARASTWDCGLPQSRRPRLSSPTRRGEERRGRSAALAPAPTPWTSLAPQGPPSLAQLILFLAAPLTLTDHSSIAMDVQKRLLPPSWCFCCDASQAAGLIHHRLMPGTV